MLLLFVLAVFLVFPVTETVDRKYTVLQFGSTSSDFISFGYDMTPFRTSLTVCCWMKRVSTSSSYPVVFYFLASSSTYEILITSDGQYNRVIGNAVLDGSQSKFNTPAGQWFLYCLTWSSSSRTMQLYLDGELAASGQTSSGRELHTSGTVWFNRFGNQDHVFGGQIYRFNMYTEVLSSETIKRIADGGLCAEVEEGISSRQLRWEDVLAKSRSGSVVEFTVCDNMVTIKQLKVMREQLDEVINKLDTTEDDLVTVTSKLNSTQEELQNVTSELSSTQEELQTVTGRLNRTEDELQRTRVSLESETARRNRTENEFQRTKVSLESETFRCNQTEDELQRTKVSLESETSRCNQTEDELQRTKVSLESETSRCNQTEDELQRTKVSLEFETSRCNRTENELQKTKVSLESETSRCNQTEDELQRTKVSLETEVTKSNRTKEELNTCTAKLTASKSQMEGARRFQDTTNITKWDILYTSSYFNKVFTEDLLEELKSSWDLMSK